MAQLDLVRPYISPSNTHYAHSQLKIIMKINTAYGFALIVGTVAAIVTMAFHPAGFDPHASVEAVAHEMSILVGVHTLALLSVPLLVFGFAGVTMRVGWHRPEALLAFIIYAFSTVAIMFAGIADGLINAALIPEMTGASDLKLQALKAALSYNFQFNQACAKVFVVGTSLAIILWSITLFRFECLSDELELSAGLSVWPHCLACCLVTFTCPLMVSASLSCCKGCGQLPWVCRFFAPTATLLSLQQTRLRVRHCPMIPLHHFPSPNQAKQPTAGRSAARKNYEDEVKTKLDSACRGLSLSR